MLTVYLEEMLSLVAIIFLSGSFVVLPLRLFSLIQYSVYGLIFLLLIARPSLSLRCLASNKVLLILISLPILSTLWSYNHSISLRSGIVFIQTASVALFLASRFTSRQQLQILSLSVFIVALINITFVLANPAVAIHSGQHAGSWRGVFSQKNELAQIAVYSSLISFFGYFLAANKRQRYMCAAGFLIWLFLLLATTSKTGLLVYSSVSFAYLLLKTLRWKEEIFALIILCTLLSVNITGLLLLNNVDAVVGMLGRDLTLTGRTEIWSATHNFIQMRPLLGYGRSAFWNLSSGIPQKIGLMLSPDGTYIPPHSHNGFVDLTADLGYVGLAVFLSVLFFTLLRSLKFARLSKKQEALLPACYVIFLILYNITESSIMKHNSLIWMTFMMFSFYLGTLSKNYRLKVINSDV